MWLPSCNSKDQWGLCPYLNDRAVLLLAMVCTWEGALTKTDKTPSRPVWESPRGSGGWHGPTVTKGERDEVRPERVPGHGHQVLRGY